jgi:predicted nicotinamide N-methyase
VSLSGPRGAARIGYGFQGDNGRGEAGAEAGLSDTTWPEPPDDAALGRMLDAMAPLRAPLLVPEVQAFYGDSLVAVWEAAERLAGRELPAPFWAYPWAAGVALARVILDHPEWVRGRRVLDVGCGGGIAALAAARAGAASVMANDIDPWALAVTRLAAARQGLAVETLAADLTAAPASVLGYDVVTASDLGYERSTSPRQHALLRLAHEGGARVVAADAGRTYFEADGLIEIARYTIAVPQDLEGVTTRVARVFVAA